MSMVSAHVRSLAWLAGILASVLVGLAGKFAGLAREVAGFAGGLTRFDGGLAGFVMRGCPH